VPPHLTKEMAIINLREKVEPRQFALAAAAIQGLSQADVSTEAGPNALVIFRSLASLASLVSARGCLLAVAASCMPSSALISALSRRALCVSVCGSRLVRS
jgi:hypothetical protein